MTGQVRASVKHSFGVRLTESPSDGSVRVRDIAANTPAAQAGVPRAGDVLLQLSVVPSPGSSSARHRGGQHSLTDGAAGAGPTAAATALSMRRDREVLKIDLEHPPASGGAGGITALHAHAAVIKQSLKVRYRMRAMSARAQLHVRHTLRSPVRVHPVASA
eukprot:COSAG01_NODE_1191_length_11314_cov_59.567722_10_plen_161_part_00